MDQDTTTESTVAPEAEPTQLIDEEAPLPQEEATTDEADATQTQTQTETDTTDPETMELQAWAAKANVPLDDPLKLAKMVRDGQRKVTEVSKKHSELQRSIADSAQPQQTGNEVIDTILQNQHNLETKTTLSEFFGNNPEARDLEDAMAEYLEETKTTNPTLAAGLANDLQSLYSLTKLSRGTDVGGDVEEARRQERETIARQQRAAVPTAAASSSVDTDTLTSANVDDKVAEMSPEEYKRRLPEINRILQG